MYNENIKKYDIAMKLKKSGKRKEAEKIFLEILRENRRNKYVLFEMGKIRLQDRDTKGAEAYFKECIEYFPKNAYPRLELGKLYSKQGKEKEAEEQFKKYIEIDRDKSPHARLELGKLYSKQGKEKEAERMYSYIIENLDYDITDTQSRIRHIQKHMKDDLTKDIHGVYTMDFMEILNIAIKNRREKQIGYMCDIYCINVPGCGYEGGRKGDGHALNFVTLITLPNSDNIITMFPSDEIVIRNREKEDILDESDISDDGHGEL